jgi:hypothetical protein
MKQPISIESIDRVTKFEIENAEAMQKQSVPRQHVATAHHNMSVALLGMVMAEPELIENKTVPNWWNQRRERLSELCSDFQAMLDATNEPPPLHGAN